MLVLAAWWSTAWLTTAARMSDPTLSDGMRMTYEAGPGAAATASFGAAHVAVLAGTGLLLLTAGWRHLALAVPALAAVPGVLAPTFAVVLGPQHQTLTGFESVGQLRFGALLTAVAVAAPAATGLALGAPRRSARAPRLPLPRLGVPVVVAGVAAVFDLVDPSGPGPVAWPGLAMLGLTASLLVVSPLPRPVVWAGVLLLPLLSGPASVYGLLGGVGHVLDDSAVPLGVAVGCASWVTAAPALARAWCAALRRPSVAQPV